MVLVETEAQAWAGTDRERIYSTVPDGLANLALADLAALRDRNVVVVLGVETLPWSGRIHHALLNARVATASFISDYNDTPVSFETLEKTAAELGIDLLLTPTNDTAVGGSSVVVASAGQALLGGNDLRRMLLDPIIREGYLIWLYGEPKSGKSWMAWSIADAVATGNSTLARWKSSEPCDVLLVDGENLPDELAQSIRMVMAGAGRAPGHAPFDIICARSQPEGVIDIAEPIWQDHIKKAAKGKKLVIFDNIQSLTDNRVNVITSLRPLFMDLMNDRIAVLAIDHTNRDGDLQGSITKERLANLSIAIRYPDDEAKEDGRIQVEFPVARRLYGDDAKPFQLKKTFTKDSFVLRVLDDQAPPPPVASERVRRIAQVVFARNHAGLTFEEIKDNYSISPSTAHDYHKAAEKLIGTEKAAFEAELERLIAHRKAEEIPTA
ncbi:AAA family ATPase [Magnetospirillum sp. 15-1]|uniref:AAA family ATPase n=1 Tax=Magnetospirillum sp. 15-1 TaxID=1979370 RepID=UPI001482AA99|nr:AAA family ATPase [Magnetospirillum sp. 15-1]